MSNLENEVKKRQAKRENGLLQGRREDDRGDKTPARPTTYVVPGIEELLQYDMPDNISPSSPASTFRGKVPSDGDLAKTVGETINVEGENRYFIRVDGEWVNILGLCSDDEANVQPIHGLKSHPGVSKCLAAADHRHGIPDSVNYLKKAFKNGEWVESLEEYGEGTFRFDNDLKRGYLKCNNKWVCITHIE